MSRVKNSGGYGYFPDIIVTPHRTCPTGYEPNEPARFSGAVNQFDYFSQPQRKEQAMRNLNLDHVGAIDRAEGYIHPHIIPNMTAHHRLKIEQDLERLAEVKRFIVQTIYEPGLPIGTLIPKEPKTDGDTR